MRLARWLELLGSPGGDFFPTPSLLSAALLMRFSQFGCWRRPRTWTSGEPSPARATGQPLQREYSARGPTNPQSMGPRLQQSSFTSVN